MLEKLFTSKVRLRLLQYFLSHRNTRYYQRQLVKLLGIHIRSLQIELSNLLNIGFLEREKDGNRICYFVNDKFPLLEELYKLILKGSFLAEKLKMLLASKNVELAFIYGSASKGDLLEGSDIDVFVIGKPDPYKLHKAIKELEKGFSRVINYIVYSKQEAFKKVKEKVGFITEVLDSDRVYLKGTEDGFRKIIKR